MKNKRIVAITFSLLLTLSSYGQQITPEEFLQKIEFCNTNLPNELIPEIKKELKQLENHFIERGLLVDNSGKSYYNVYKRIAETNSFNFQTNISLTILDSLAPQTITTCFFKLLTEDQLSKVNQHHLESASNNAKGFDGETTIGVIAQRFVDLFTSEDFELDYFKQSSLLGFYKMSSPNNGILSVFPKYEVKSNANELLQINLNEQSEIWIFGKAIDMDHLTKLVEDFIKIDPIQRAISINSSRNASYESYLKMIEAVNKSINELREELASQKFKMSFSELSSEQKNQVKKAVPRNVIISELK
ncbi:hypothetical protein [Cyclobacterium sediminis]